MRWNFDATSSKYLPIHNAKISINLLEIIWKDGMIGHGKDISDCTDTVCNILKVYIQTKK